MATKKTSAKKNTNKGRNTVWKIEPGSELAVLLDAEEYDDADMTPEEAIGMNLLNRCSAGNTNHIKKLPTVIAAKKVIAEING